MILNKPSAGFRCTPRGAKAAEEVGRLRVQVAVEDVQALPAHGRRQLAHGGLPGARLAHQQRWLCVLQAPAAHGCHM